MHGKVGHGLRSDETQTSDPHLVRGACQPVDVYCYAMKNSGRLQASSRSTVLFVLILLAQLLVLKLHVLSEVSSMMHALLNRRNHLSHMQHLETWKQRGGLHMQDCSS